jgi:hypothetical protein
VEKHGQSPRLWALIPAPEEAVGLSRETVEGLGVLHLATSPGGCSSPGRLGFPGPRRAGLAGVRPPVQEGGLALRVAAGSATSAARARPLALAPGRWGACACAGRGGAGAGTSGEGRRPAVSARRWLRREKAREQEGAEGRSRRQSRRRGPGLGECPCHPSIPPLPQHSRRLGPLPAPRRPPPLPPRPGAGGPGATVLASASAAPRASGASQVWQGRGAGARGDWDGRVPPAGPGRDAGIQRPLPPRTGRPGPRSWVSPRAAAGPCERAR